MITRRIFLGIASTIFMTAGLPSLANAQDKKVYSVMIVPQFPSVKISESWTPLLQELGKRLSVEFQLTFSQDIPAFEKEFIKGTPDIIYCNPYHAVMAHKAQGYQPIVRGKNQLKGILVTPENGERAVSDLKELEGKTLLFPAPNAFGASLYMRALLAREHGLHFEAKYVKTHPNVIRGVIRGEGAAGGMVMRTLSEEPEGVRSKVKILYETPPAPSHPIAVHPRVGQQMISKIQSTIMEIIKQSPEMSENIQIGNPILTQYEPEYQGLENLGLESFAKIE